MKEGLHDLTIRFRRCHTIPTLWGLCFQLLGWCLILFCGGWLAVCRVVGYILFAAADMGVRMVLSAFRTSYSGASVTAWAFSSCAVDSSSNCRSSGYILSAMLEKGERLERLREANVVGLGMIFSFSTRRFAGNGGNIAYLRRIKGAAQSQGSLSVVQPSEVGQDYMP